MWGRELAFIFYRKESSWSLEKGKGRAVPLTPTNNCAFSVDGGDDDKRGAPGAAAAADIIDLRLSVEKLAVYQSAF